MGFVGKEKRKKNCGRNFPKGSLPQFFCMKSHQTDSDFTDIRDLMIAVFGSARNPLCNRKNQSSMPAAVWEKEASERTNFPEARLSATNGTYPWPAPGTP